MRYTLFAVLLMSVSAFSDALNSQVDQLFREFDRPNVPGASVAVILDGKIAYERGYGLANLSEGTPAMEHTTYRLASVSKQFTAMANLILINEGKLSLDQRLTEIFPELPSYANAIKVRHLLGHISGLRDYEDLIPAGQTEQLTDYDVLKIYSRQSSTNFTPGSQYSYSNGGFVMLGLIAEKVSGMNYGNFLKERIFRPLGMNDTVLMEKGVPIPNRAYGYSSNGSGFSQTDQSMTSATRGDGCVYASVHDWLKWETALAESSLISPELQKLAFTPGKLNGGGSTDYGFGFMLGTYQGFPKQYHTGSTIGFRTAMERVPEKGIAVVVLINRANSEPWTIARRILDLYLNAQD